jgi:hypothetical protein
MVWGQIKYDEINERSTMVITGWLHRESEIYGRPRDQSRIINLYAAGCGSRDADSESFLLGIPANELHGTDTYHAAAPSNDLKIDELMPRYKFKPQSPTSTLLEAFIRYYFPSCESMYFYGETTQSIRTNEHVIIIKGLGRPSTQVGLVQLIRF